MTKTSKYIYWIEFDGSSVGGYQTRKEAKSAMEALNLDKNWRVVRYLAQPCPICHKLEKDAVIDELGRCLACLEIDTDLPNYPPDQFNMVRSDD
jgi:nitrate reductase cytochrome c-type subunit